MNKEELYKRFLFRPMSDEQARKYQIIRGKIAELSVLVIESTVVSREQSLVITKLEEAMMWCNSAIKNE